MTKFILKPKNTLPGVYFQLTEDCGGGKTGDWVFAWPSEGRLTIVSDDAVRQQYDVLDAAPRGRPPMRAGNEAPR